MSIIRILRNLIEHKRSEAEKQRLRQLKEQIDRNSRYCTGGKHDFKVLAKGCLEYSDIYEVISQCKKCGKVIHT